MSRGFLLFAALLFAATAPCYSQSSSDPDMQNQAPPRSDDLSPGESSSKETRIDLRPPSGDEKMHPNSGIADDVLEMHPYDPHRAEKNIEVGNYYYKLKNYRAAESRYREALEYKPNDAEATFKLGIAQESLGQKEDAIESFQSYLKILPNGPHADECKAAIERITNPPQLQAKDTKKKKSK